METLLSDSNEDMLAVGTSKVIISGNNALHRLVVYVAVACSEWPSRPQSPATATISQSAGEHQCPHYRTSNTMQLSSSYMIIDLSLCEETTKN